MGKVSYGPEAGIRFGVPKANDLPASTKPKMINSEYHEADFCALLRSPRLG